MKNIRNRYCSYILPVVTAGLALLLVLSYLFPNKVLDTYVMNISEEGDTEEAITLPEGSVISYTMNTGKRPLRGIQPSIGMQGGPLENAVLRYRVYKKGSDALLSDNEYRLKELSAAVLNTMQALPEGEAAQFAEAARYIYLPLNDYEKCKGEIRLEFTYESNGDEPQRLLGDGENGLISPYLMTNNVQKDGTAVKKDGVDIAGGLVGYTVYTHNTYPLVYDLRIMVFLFLAATAAAPLDRWRKSAGVKAASAAEKTEDMP